jgi:phage terminase large subunit-like protein
MARVQNVLPIIDQGMIWVPESKKEPGQPVTWAREFYKECVGFPNGEHDDYVDTMSQALLYLRDANWLLLPQIEEEEQDLIEIAYHKKSQRQWANPYAQ